MKKINLLIISFLLILNSSFPQNKVEAPKPLLPVPSASQLARQEMELCAFIHFTTNTFTDQEWGMGSEKESVFNPTEANPNQWVSVLLKETGEEGISLPPNYPTESVNDGNPGWDSAHTIY